jgi:hypothetical protein
MLRMTDEPSVAKAVQRNIKGASRQISEEFGGVVFLGYGGAELRAAAERHLFNPAYSHVRAFVTYNSPDGPTYLLCRPEERDEIRCLFAFA